MKSEEEQKAIEQARHDGKVVEWISDNANGLEKCWEDAPAHIPFDWDRFDYRIKDAQEDEPEIDLDQEITPIEEKSKPEVKTKPKAAPKENVHFSSNNDEWETPQALFDTLDAEFNFSVDLCTSDSNSKCDIGVQELELYVPLIRDKEVEVSGTMFMNPPYSRGKQKKMVGLANELFLMGKTVVCLLPARTDTAMFHNYIWDKKTHKPKTGVEMRLLQGRVTFEQNGEPVRDAKGRPQPAPFPSVVVVFRGDE